MGTLYVGSIPPGDPSNVTARLQRVLQGVPLIIAEDTGRTQRLLEGLGLAGPCILPARDLDLLAALETSDAALLLDGWHPCPTGIASLVRLAVESGFPVVPVPGPSLPITALVASGLPCASFVYAGKAPPTPTGCKAFAEAMAGEARTLVFEAVIGQLSSVASALGERPVAIATSSEDGLRLERWPSLAVAVESLADCTAGEPCILVVGGSPPKVAAWTEERLRAEVEAWVRQGFRAREIAPSLAAESGWPRRTIYGLAVETIRQENNTGAPVEDVE